MFIKSNIRVFASLLIGSFIIGTVGVYKSLALEANEQLVVNEDEQLIVENNEVARVENEELPVIDRVEDDQQPVEVSFALKAINTDMEVASGLGVVNNINGFLFTSQVDNGATLDDWGEAFELNFDHLFHFTFDDNDYSVGAAFGVELHNLEVNSSRSLNVAQGFTIVYVDLLPINGDVSPGAIFNFPITGLANIRYKVVFRRLYADIRATKEINPNFRISGSWYASLSKLTLNSSVFGLTIDPNNPNNEGEGRASLDQRVDSYSTGPCILLETNHQIHEEIYVFLNAKAGILFSRGNMKATQEGFREVVDQFSPDVPGVRNADDNSEDIAVVGSLESGVILEITEHSAITLLGAVEYRNDSYEIINPRSAEGIDADDPTSFGGTSSYIEQVDQINLYGGIEYTHTF